MIKYTADELFDMDNVELTALLAEAEVQVAGLEGKLLTLSAWRHRRLQMWGEVRRRLGL